MRYRIHGVNRATGNETSMTVEAADRPAAETIGQRSLVVAEIIEEPDPLDVLAQYQPPAVSDVAAAEDRARMRGPMVARTIAPDYLGIRLGAAVLRVFSLLYYAAAAVGLVLVIIGILRYASDKTTNMESTLTAFLWTLAAFMVAALIGLLSSLSIAIRDMARNSFGREDFIADPSSAT